MDQLFDEIGYDLGGGRERRRGVAPSSFERIGVALKERHVGQTQCLLCASGYLITWFPIFVDSVTAVVIDRRDTLWFFRLQKFRSFAR